MHAMQDRDATGQEAPPAGGARIRPDYLLCALLALALLLRLAYASYPPESARHGLGPFGDSWSYHVIAFNLARGAGYTASDAGAAKGLGADAAPVTHSEPAATRAPLYPLFLATIYRLAGLGERPGPEQLTTAFTLVRIVQCALGALGCLLCYLLVRAWLPGERRGALLAAAICALSPFHIYYTRAILSETVATLLVLATAWMATRAARQASGHRWLGAGACCGLLALCRPEYALLPVFLAAAAALLPLPRAHKAIGALALLAGALLVLSPWLARNHALFSQPFISASGFGYNLYLGTREGRTGFSSWGAPTDPAMSEAERSTVEALAREFQLALRAGSIRVVGIDARFRSMAIDRIAADPAGTLCTWVQNWPRLLYQNYQPMYRDPEPPGWLVILIGSAAILGLAAVRGAGLPAAAIVAYPALLYLPLHIEPRYFVPALAVLICLAGAGLSSLRRPPPLRPA